MKGILQLTIPGVPVAKARPRVIRTKSGASYAYNTTRTAEAQENVRQHLMVALRGWQADKMAAYGLKAFFFFPAGKRKAAGFPHIGRPDLDNLLKLVFDALKPWLDDAQICQLEGQKFYGEVARTELALVEL